MHKKPELQNLKLTGYQQQSKASSNLLHDNQKTHTIFTTSINTYWSSESLKLRERSGQVETRSSQIKLHHPICRFSTQQDRIMQVTIGHKLNKRLRACMMLTINQAHNQLSRIKIRDSTSQKQNPRITDQHTDRVNRASNRFTQQVNKDGGSESGNHFIKTQPEIYEKQTRFK